MRTGLGRALHHHVSKTSFWKFLVLPGVLVALVVPVPPLVFYGSFAPCAVVQTILGVLAAGTPALWRLPLGICG